MTNFLLRRFVPDYQNTADPAVREKYGNLAGIVGIVCNVLLFAGKLLAGTGGGGDIHLSDGPGRSAAAYPSRRTPLTTSPTRQALS